MSEMELIRTQEVTNRVQSLEMGRRAPGRQKDERKGQFKKALQEQMEEALPPPVEPSDYLEAEHLHLHPEIKDIAGVEPGDAPVSTYQADGRLRDEESEQVHHINIVVG